MIGYIAKDKSNEIYLYTEKPQYANELEGWFSFPDMLNITGQFTEFNNMSYKDEPIKVEIKLERI
jgi:hypothetical protein